MRQVLILSPLCRWETGSERCSDMPKETQLVCGEVGQGGGMERERLRSQALNHRALNLIERWHKVGAVIQQRKEGETWPGNGWR